MDKQADGQQQERPYTAASLAAAAGVSGAYVARLCKQGKLACEKLNRQTWLIRYEVGQAWLEARQAKPAQEL